MQRNVLHEEVKDRRLARSKSLRKAMSDHVAYAMLVYTGLNILVTMKAVHAGKGVILPYLALIFLVAAIIPVLRWLEQRWEDKDTYAQNDHETAGLFRRDVVMLWTGAIGLPLLLTGVCRLGALLT